MIGYARQRRCPFEEAQYCPLYHASHDPRAGGCLRDNWELGCDVDQGILNFGEAIEVLRDTQPHLVARVGWQHRKSQFMAQRDRNMRLNGIRQ